MVFFGGTLLLASQLGRESRLLQKYDDLAKSCSRSVEAMIPDFSKAQRLYQLELMKSGESGGAAGAMTDIESLESNRGLEPGLRDPDLMTSSEKAFRKLQEHIRELRDAEKLYLQKLIELSPGDGSFKFRYAMAHLPLNSAIVPDLVSALAPIDEGLRGSSQIGNPEAHLWMAKYYAQRPKANEREVQLAFLMIEKHASRCLVVDSTNREARELRAQVLQRGGEYSRAFDDYSALFEQDARYFSNLVQLNKLMNREARNTEVLDRAASRLHRELVSNRENVAVWETAWEMYADCMMRRRRFTQLRQELQVERDMFATDELKRNFLNSILGSAFSSRVAELQATVAENPVDADEVIQILETASTSMVLNDFLKFHCTMLVRNNPALAERARLVYDYEKDPDPSAMVLGEIAIDALTTKDYARAISILEKARAKMPNNPILLNNLAFAYLSSESSNPSKALELVDQAIRQITSGQFSDEELSRFLHTRGVALMQMNRVAEAEGALLEALKARQDNEGILEALIQCYEGRDEIQKGVFMRRLQEVRKSQDPANDSKQ